MPNYRRVLVPGGTYFFTVTLLERHGNDLLVRYIDVLREAARTTKYDHPFAIHAWVALPDHCVKLGIYPQNWSTPLSELVSLSDD